ncbi:hypothetical protein ACFL38_02720 [Candidatus Omnitrophota bacterium]
MKHKENTKASALLTVFLVIIICAILGSVFLLMSVNESKIATQQRVAATALHIAEAGIEQALDDLRQDFDSASPGWDADINGIDVSAVWDPTGTTYYELYPLAAFNDGTYHAQLRNVVGTNEAIWVRSDGTFQGTTKTIEVYARMRNVSIWGNAIFAGTGGTETAINGNVHIRGSVHILGDGLDTTELAVHLGGTAELIGNNYNTLRDERPDLALKVPALPTTDFGGDVGIETLFAELRVKRGRIQLDGTSAVGEEDVAGNTVKETIDGSYVTDGYEPGSELNVYSDNGYSNHYDLGDSITFPSLNDEVEGYANYYLYFEDQGVVVNDTTYPGSVAQLANIEPGSIFEYGDCAGSDNCISMDGAGHMTVKGQVYIDSGDFNTYKDSNGKEITYEGTGTLLVNGNVEITTDLMTVGADSFPNPSIIGILTPNTLTIGTNSQRAVMGVFFAENAISIDKQTNVLGTIVSKYFDMGGQVPRIYQVPETINNMPVGMPGDDGGWLLSIVSWQEL